MAMKQGTTREEIEELLLFMGVYAGFKKAAGCVGVLNELPGPKAAPER
jgi:4-carboxymuconolactone decarboxylase